MSIELMKFFCQTDKVGITEKKFILRGTVYSEVQNTD